MNYRASAKLKAEELGACGFIKNEKDGSVYLEAEGPEEKINELLAWCKQGPAHAHVTNVISNPGELNGRSGFEIRR